MIKIMFTFPGRLLLAAGALAIAAHCEAQQQLYKRKHDTALEIAQLPKFCYDQYVDTSLSRNPEYSITAACGIGMNHFCPGLLNLMRAQKGTLSRDSRRGHLRQGKENVEYTVVRMPANCRYRDDVNAAMVRVQTLEKILR
jgi:hypothetical protein